MKRKTFVVSFYVKKTKLLKSGEAPIFMKITVDSVKEEIAIKRSIKLEHWDSNKGCAKPVTVANKSLNQYLDHIKNRLYSIQKELEEENKTVTAELLKNRYRGINDANVTFVELYTEHNKKLSELIGKGFAKATVTRHETSMNHVIDFLKYKYNKTDILFREITPDFIREYEHYLRTVKNCNNNTTVKYIRNMGKVVSLAEQKGIIKTNPMKSLKFRIKEVNKEFLLENELNELLKKEFVSERLNQVRDVFAFCCFTGLAFVDVKQLRENDFVTDNEGNVLIRKQRQKTEIWYTVLLLPVAKQILDKYRKKESLNGQLLPVPSNQKMNAYLKEIATVCGIDKTLTTHMARHTFATTVTLANNVSIESVSKMLGHKSIKMTQHYAKILEKTVVREMSSLSGKLSYSY